MIVFYTASLGYHLFYTIFYKFATSDNIFKWNLGKHGQILIKSEDRRVDAFGNIEQVRF